MGEEINTQLFYVPIRAEHKPIALNPCWEVEEFPATKTENPDNYTSFSMQINARVKRIWIETYKLPRKKKKRFKKQFSKQINIPTKYIYCQRLKLKK